MLPIFIITCGCFSSSKDLTCTIDDEFEGIQTTITVVTKFSKKTALSSKATAVMHFDTEDEAQEYYNSMDEQESGTLDGSDLIVVTEQEFTEEDDVASRSELKILFENSGYTCK